MTTILAIVGGCLLVIQAFVFRIRFRNMEKYRAALLTGLIVLIGWIFHSDILLLLGKAGFVVGLALFGTWVVVGILFAYQSRKDYRRNKAKAT